MAITSIAHEQRCSASCVPPFVAMQANTYSARVAVLSLMSSAALPGRRNIALHRRINAPKRNRITAMARRSVPHLLDHIQEAGRGNAFELSAAAAPSLPCFDRAVPAQAAERGHAVLEPDRRDDHPSEPGAAGTTQWGPDQCRNDPDGSVDFDERLRITGVSSGRYDARFTDRTGRTCTVTAIDIKAGAVFSIGKEALKHCAEMSCARHAIDTRASERGDNPALSNGRNRADVSRVARCLAQGSLSPPVL